MKIAHTANIATVTGAWTVRAVATLWLTALATTPVATGATNRR